MTLVLAIVHYFFAGLLSVSLFFLIGIKDELSQKGEDIAMITSFVGFLGYLGTLIAVATILI